MFERYKKTRYEKTLEAAVTAVKKARDEAWKVYDTACATAQGSGESEATAAAWAVYYKLAEAAIEVADAETVYYEAQEAAGSGADETSQER